MGLKPVWKPACPKCPFELRYHFRDPEMHPDKWVLTEASREHLATAHVLARPQLHIVQATPDLIAA